jgi:hypothetical protein
MFDTFLIPLNRYKCLTTMSCKVNKYEQINRYIGY